jgi:type I restriction enzyme S subunit
MNKFVKLKDIVDILCGFPFKGDLYSDSGIRVVRGENITIGRLRWDSVKCWNGIDLVDLKKYSLQQGDVVIGMDGSRVGKNRAKITTEDLPLLLAQRVARLRSKDSSGQAFLYYVVRDNRFEQYVNRIQTGSSIPHISQSQIEEFSVPEFSPYIQQKIGSVLSCLDAKIELNYKINAELECVAKTLYDYWFAKFDFPDKEGRPYKSSGGEMVYDERLKRKIPKGWRSDSLFNLASVLVRGISPKYVEDAGIPVINQKCIRNKIIDFSFARRHDFIAKTVDSKLIKVGDVLINSTGVGTLGRVAMVKWLEELITTVDSHITIVRVNNKKANSYYFGYALTEKQSEIEQLGEGSTGQTELSRDNLGKLTLLLPDNNIQTAFEKLLIPIFEKVAINEKQNRELIELRDWLLPMLMNGQVKVD